MCYIIALRTSQQFLYNAWLSIDRTSGWEFEVSSNAEFLRNFPPLGIVGLLELSIEPVSAHLGMMLTFEDLVIPQVPALGTVIGVTIPHEVVLGYPNPLHGPILRFL